MDPVKVAVIVGVVLLALSSVTVARYGGGKWTVKRVIMGVPVEWESKGTKVTEDGYTAWSVQVGGLPRAPWPWRKGE